MKRQPSIHVTELELGLALGKIMGDEITCSKHVNLLAKKLVIELRTKKNYYKRGYHRQESFVTEKLWNDA